MYKVKLSDPKWYTMSTKWKIGQKCEFYARLQQLWVKAEVIDIFKDKEGQWVKVRYGRNYTDVHPDSSDIRNVADKHDDNGWNVQGSTELSE